MKADLLSKMSMKQLQKSTADHISKQFCLFLFSIFMWYSPDYFFVRDIRRHLSSAIHIYNEISLQWILSIEDMHYSGHRSIADTFSRNQLSPPMVKLLYFKPLNSWHLSIANTFFENQGCPLLRSSTLVSFMIWNRLY